jgi:hypothetical protein
MRATAVRRAFSERAKGDGLNAEIVFEIKDRSLVIEPASEFTAGSSNPWIRPRVRRTLSARKGLGPLLLTLLFDTLFGRNRIRDVAGRAGFVGIVEGLRAAG